jgi:hypothetical protein
VGNIFLAVIVELVDRHSRPAVCFWIGKVLVVSSAVGATSRQFMLPSTLGQRPRYKGRSPSRTKLEIHPLDTVAILRARSLWLLCVERVANMCSSFNSCKASTGWEDRPRCRP